MVKQHSKALRNAVTKEKPATQVCQYRVTGRGRQVRVGNLVTRLRLVALPELGFRVEETRSSNLVGTLIFNEAATITWWPFSCPTPRKLTRTMS